MKYWDGVPPIKCVDGFGAGTHLLVASRGGWSFFCVERPERWQTMKGAPTDDPVVIPHSDEPTCEVCALLVKKNASENLTSANWPITWKKVF